MSSAGGVTDNFEKFQRSLVMADKENVTDETQRREEVGHSANGHSANEGKNIQLETRCTTSNQQGGGVTTDGATGMHLNILFENMMLENRRRDAMLEKLIDRIAVSNNSVSAENTTNLSVMPEVLRNINKFNGDIKSSQGLDQIVKIKSLKAYKFYITLPDT
ncbi:hypothetical protein QE152_g38736 [Popillia japonica]|uniref:Uncharacterized protein n=1 Tax=Popillia japonica TaxID=7064 RepID=A0AAW1HWT5_POPJA